MNNNKTASSGGIGIIGVLTILFVVLKLLNIIQWSWLWVLSPLWISAGVGIIVLLMFLAFWIIALRNIK